MKTLLLILLFGGVLTAQTASDGNETTKNLKLLELIRKDSLSADEKKIYADLKYKGTEYQENQNKVVGDSSRFRTQILLREKEAALGFGIEKTFGLYRMTLPLLSTILVYSDPNYDKKVNASLTCLVSIGAGLFGGMMHKEDVGEGARDIILYILVAPMLIANSEHHLMLIPSGEGSLFEASFYLTSRTDIFYNWWRYTTGGGLQMGFNLNKYDDPYCGREISLQIGYEKALFGKGIYDNNLRWFGGLSYAFGIK